MEVKQKSFKAQQMPLNVHEKGWKNKKINVGQRHFQRLKTEDLTNHKESSDCLREKLNSARLSFEDSATSSVISYKL